jgi:hypothetical protein
LGLLGKAAAIAINEVIALREGEEALIATNFEGEAFPVAEAYYAPGLWAVSLYLWLCRERTADRLTVSPRGA